MKWRKKKKINWGYSTVKREGSELEEGRRWGWSVSDGCESTGERERWNEERNEESAGGKKQEARNRNTVTDLAKNKSKRKSEMIEMSS